MLGPSDLLPGQSSAGPQSLVEISVSCRNLQDKDFLSKSDPQCVLYMKDTYTDRYTEIGRTEVVENSLNPDFAAKFTINYYFEEVQQLRFDIYDSDSTSQQLDRHDYLGRLDCLLAEIVTSTGTQLKRSLKSSSGKHVGNIIVSAEELSACKELVSLQFSASNLDKKDMFGKSDPFLVISKVGEDGHYTVVHKTEVIKSNLNPTWRPFTIPVRTLCNGDHDRRLRIECFDWDGDGGSHDFIGDISTTLKQLKRGPGQENFYEFINMKKKQKKSSYKNSGTLKLLSLTVTQDHSFLDFVRSGMQINFTVAVDFTASNGEQTQPNSLHFLNPHQPNQYMMAIRAVGDIVQEYDTDKLFPALGFGAKVPPHGEVSHEFALSFDLTNPYCQGVDGILSAYYQCLPRVTLYGPTNFSPIIHHVARFATSVQDGTNYFVLLIITDGIITDMERTKEAIVKASGLPMSIIIVGVGNSDFAAMQELDGDVVKITSHGQPAVRDIVQFVPFRDFYKPQNWAASQIRLAKEVLAEIPQQVVAYMRMRNIQPKPVTAAPVDPAGLAGMSLSAGDSAPSAPQFQ